MRQWTADALRALDAEDPLAAFRERFLLPRGCVYLAAHVLGPMPAGAPSAVAEACARSWAGALEEAGAWSPGTGPSAELARAIAGVVGAAPQEIAVGDPLPVTAFTLLRTALALRPGRSVVLLERGIETVLREVAQGLGDLLRGEVELRLLEDEEPLADALDEQVACLCVSHVDDRTGRLNDLAALAAAAHEVGALLFVDVSHSAGAMPVELGAANVDLAVGCGARFLCGGPGAPAFSFVSERHGEAVRAFARARAKRATPSVSLPAEPSRYGIGGFLASSPSPLALSALHCGLALVAGADLERARAKAMRAGEAFEALVAERLASYGVSCASPKDPRARGPFLAFAHPHAASIAEALAEHGVVADTRPPDLVRFGFGPLWNSYEEVWIAAERFAEVVLERLLIGPSTPAAPSAS